MSGPDMHEDERFEAMLRELGPEVPRPSMDDGARARLAASIAGAPAGRARRLGGAWGLAAGLGLAAVLAVACVVMGGRLDRARGELARAEWETDEALTLLMRARASQEAVSVPEDLSGVRGGDLVVMTFDHELCPLARVSTPGFRRLAAARDGAARFMVFDVTGDKREGVGEELASLGIGYAAAEPLGAETGVVKVLDTRRGRVISSAPGARGLAQAESVLARVGGASPAP